MIYRNVFRVEPRRISDFGRVLEAHQMRLYPPGGKSRNTDPERKHLNKVLVGSENIRADLEAVLSKFPKRQSNSADAAEILLTAHRDYFDEICPEWQSGKYTPAFRKWVAENVRFLKEKFGEGVVSVVLHMDETTPHIHANIIPIAESKFGNRHGSFTKKTVDYGHFFNDRRNVIREARATVNPELTKLGRWQTAYYKEVGSKLGLHRGVVGSIRKRKDEERHARQRRSTKNMPRAPRDTVVIPEVSLSDKLAVATGSESRQAVAYNKKIEQQSNHIKKLESYIGTIEAKAFELQHVQYERDQLIELHNEKDNAMDELRKELEEVRRRLDEVSNVILKEEKDRLRKTDLTLVAQELGYTGPMNKPDGKPMWKGAADMTMDILRVSLDDSFRWLKATFGTEYLPVVIEQHESEEYNQRYNDRLITVSSPEFDKGSRPLLTKQQYAVHKNLEKQLDALDAERYRIILTGGENGAWNLGKSKVAGDPERFWSKAEVLDKVRFLNYRNNQGNNILLTPLHSKYHYVLLDDLNKETLDPWLAQGVSPTLIQYSSYESIQGVLKIEKNGADKEAVNHLFKAQNKKFGDKNISGLIHGFRAAGFRNVKPKHARIDEQGRRTFPVVTLKKAVNTACAWSYEQVRGILAGLAKKPQRILKSELNSVLRELDQTHIVDVPGDLDAIARRHYFKLKERYGAGIDLSRADFMLCEKALKLGFSNAEIASALLNFSPDIRSRKHNVMYYLDKTIQKAKLAAPEAVDAENPHVYGKK